MKKVLLLTLSLMLVTSMAFAQGGGIGLYDASWANCDIVDAAMGLIPVYVVHKLTPGATASQFMLQNGGGFNCTYTGESSPMPTVIGNAYAGISIGYGPCRVSDILVLTVNFFCTGTSPACAYIEVIPDPTAPTGTIEIVDCSFIKHIGVGSMMFFNNDGTCGRPCGLPAHDTSWGKIKSMYN